MKRSYTRTKKGLDAEDANRKKRKMNIAMGFPRFEELPVELKLRIMRYTDMDTMRHLGLCSRTMTQISANNDMSLLKGAIDEQWPELNSLIGLETRAVSLNGPSRVVASRVSFVDIYRALDKTPFLNMAARKKKPESAWLEEVVRAYRIRKGGEMQVDIHPLNLGKGIWIYMSFLKGLRTLLDEDVTILQRVGVPEFSGKVWCPSPTFTLRHFIRKIFHGESAIKRTRPRVSKHAKSTRPATRPPKSDPEDMYTLRCALLLMWRLRMGRIAEDDKDSEVRPNSKWAIRKLNKEEMCKIVEQASPDVQMYFQRLMNAIISRCFKSSAFNELQDVVTYFIAWCRKTFVGLHNVKERAAEFAVRWAATLLCDELLFGGLQHLDVLGVTASRDVATNSLESKQCVEDYMMKLRSSWISTWVDELEMTAEEIQSRWENTLYVKMGILTKYGDEY